MLPLVLLAALDGLELLVLDLAGLLDDLWRVTVALDAGNLGHMAVAAYEGVVVLEGLAVASRLDALSLGGICAPEADVAVVGAGEEVLCVGGPFGREHALHALCVVHVAGVAAVAVPEADGAVPGGGDELLSRGGELDVHDGGDVALEDVAGAVHLAHVEEVDVVVLGGGGEVEGLHGGPGDAVAGEGEDGLCDGGGGAQVVDDDGAVVGARGEDGRLDVVEGDVCDCVGGRWPVEHLGGGCVPLKIVDGDDARCHGKGIFRAVVRETGEGAGAQPRRDRSRVAGQIIRIVELDGAVGGARQQLLVPGPLEALDDVLMRRGMPYFLPRGEIPDLDDTITAAAGEALERVGVLCQRVDAVDVAPAHLANEGRGVHALQLDGIEGSFVLARSLKGVDGRIEVSRLLDGVGAGRLVGRYGSADGLDLHVWCFFVFC